MKKSIKYCLFYSLQVLLLASCGFAHFTAMPGSERKVFPTELQGNYISLNTEKNSKDTFTLTITDTQSITNDAILKDLLQLTDSTTLSHLGDFYFFNVKGQDSANRITWTLFPIYPKNDILYIYSIPLGKQTKKLNKYLKQDINGTYIMNNEPFKNYCEKYLKKKRYRKNASKLHKIK